MLAEIEETANQILAQSPDGVVRFRLLRDVLRKSADDAELQQAREGLRESQNIWDLASEQREDGGWGRFHSRYTRLKQKIPVTEVGVERALALGLDAGHPVLEKATRYILNIMQGKTAFPDPPEKNDRWSTGVRLFLASTLCLIHPAHSALESDRLLWHTVAKRTFQSGKYDEQRELEAHAGLTGATMQGSYLVLNGKYQLNVLGSIPGTLAVELEEAILRWLWERPDGIGYLGVPLNREPPSKPGPFDRWLSSLEMLARSFPSWVDLGESSIAWLWEQRKQNGYWDFGPRSSSASSLPLSDGWRVGRNREYDWTTRVLTLLRRYHTTGEL